MNRSLTPSLCLLAATCLGTVAAAPSPARAQPWDTSATRYGEIESLVASEAGGTAAPRVLVFGLLLKSGMMIDRYIGLGWQLPLGYSLADMAGGAVGNPALDLIVVPFRHFGDYSARLWFSAGASVSFLPGAIADPTTAGALARFWVRDPALYAPDTHALRAAAELELAQPGAGHRVGIGARAQRWFGPEDRTFLFGHVSGRMRLGPLSAFTDLQLTWTSSSPAMAAPDGVAYGAELGFGTYGNAGGRLELFAYLPIADRFADVFESFGGGLRAVGFF